MQRRHKCLCIGSQTSHTVRTQLWTSRSETGSPSAASLFASSSPPSATVPRAFVGLRHRKRGREKESAVCTAADASIRMSGCVEHHARGRGATLYHSLPQPTRKKGRERGGRREIEEKKGRERERVLDCRLRGTSWSRAQSRAGCRGSCASLDRVEGQRERERERQESDRE